MGIVCVDGSVIGCVDWVLAWDSFVLIGGLTFSTCGGFASGESTIGQTPVKMDKAYCGKQNLHISIQ